MYLFRLQWRPMAFVAAAAFCLALAHDPLRGQEASSDNRIEYPLMLVHGAAVDRLQHKADLMFQSADRTEMADFVAQWMKTTLRGLPGWDRTKPFGMMFYLKPGLTPGLASIYYIPTTDAKATLGLLAGSKGVIREVPGKTGNYELTEVDWGSDEIAVKHSGDYLYVTDLADAIELDRRFPDPQRMVSKLATRYDLAFSLMLKNLPSATKTLFIAFFKTTTMAGLQQRDDEPDAAYRIRRAQGESVIDVLDKIVNQAEELTIGGVVVPETQAGLVEFELNGTKDSKLAKFFQDGEGRRSLFAPIVDEASTITLNASWQLDAKQRKPFVELFTFGPELFDAQAKKDGQPPALAALAPLCKTLLATAEQGHLDFFAQLSGKEPFDYRLVGGFRLHSNREFPQHFRNAIEYVTSLKVPEPPAEPAPKPPAQNPPNAKKNPNGGANRGQAANAERQRANAEKQRAATSKLLSGIKVADGLIGDYPVHSIPLPTPPDSMGKAMFGENPVLYLYAAPNALWFAFGGPSARETLERHVGTLANTAAPTPPKAPAAPFLLVTHFQQWVTAALSSGDTDDEDEGFAIVQKAFREDNDEIRVTSRATDTGTRTRVEFQSGYLGFLGRQIAHWIDQATDE